jgi:hypothetical protein
MQKPQDLFGLLAVISNKAIQPTGLLFGEDGGASAVFVIDRRANTPWSDSLFLVCNIRRKPNTLKF